MADTKVVSGIKTWMGWDTPTPTQESLINIAADRAENKIRSIRAQSSDEPIEDRFVWIAVEMACGQLEKQGVDNVEAFSENGISRSFSGGSYPPDLLAQIPPKACLTAFSVTTDTEV